MAHGSRRPHGRAGPVRCRQALAPDGRPSPADRRNGHHRRRARRSRAPARHPVRPFPAELEVERTVSPQSLVAFDGNFYSVPPGLPGVQVKVLHRLGEDDLRIVTAGRAVVACHRRAPRGAGQTVRDDGHVIALEKVVLSSFSAGGRPELSSLRPARHDRRPARHPGSRPSHDHQPRHRHRPAQTTAVSID
ncbi:hypothetical protein ACFY4H_25805 [Streptomyces althioticus]|uniref:Mu transposase domain-containing protein n=1 Tax=Streptomyces althioticus TaxID=83380 RepID=UPI0036C794F6